MFFRMPRFVRRYLRRRMHPMAEKDAWSWKTRLSVMYALLAWNSLGFVLYQIYKGNKHWPTSLGLTTKEEDEMRPASYFAHLIGVEKADVVRIRGLRVTRSEIDLTKAKENAQNSESSSTSA